MLAAALAALGVAIALPRGHTERVGVLSAAQERGFAPALGRPVSTGEAAQVLGRGFALPPTRSSPELYFRTSVVSAVLAAPGPVLLSEFQSGGPGVLRKLLGVSPGIESLPVLAGENGLWIPVANRIFIGPDAPAPLRGPTLLWASGKITLRLEGRGLTLATALKLARAVKRR